VFGVARSSLSRQGLQEATPQQLQQRHALPLADPRPDATDTKASSAAGETVGLGVVATHVLRLQNLPCASHLTSSIALRLMSPVMTMSKLLQAQPH
jgi:hypothetical protein